MQARLITVDPSYFDVEFESPERNLWAYVLIRAIKDYVDPHMFIDSKTEAKRIRKSAREFFYGTTEMKNYIGSFNYICKVLDIDRIKVLKAIRRLKDEGKRLDVRMLKNDD